MVTYTDIKRETMGNRRDTFAFIKIEDLKKITPSQWESPTELDISLDEWEDIIEIMQALGNGWGHVTILQGGGVYFRSNKTDNIGVFLAPCYHDEWSPR